MIHHIPHLLFVILKWVSIWFSCGAFGTIWWTGAAITNDVRYDKNKNLFWAELERDQWTVVIAAILIGPVTLVIMLFALFDDGFPDLIMDWRFPFQMPKSKKRKFLERLES